MRSVRMLLAWFLVYAMVVLPAGARTSAPAAKSSARLQGSFESRSASEAVASPECEAAVEKAAGSLARCLSKHLSREKRSRARSFDGFWGENTTSDESPLGACGRRFDRRIENANQRFDRCTEVSSVQIQEEVYQYTRQAAQLAHGAGSQITYYAFDTGAVEVTRYGTSADSSESVLGELALSGIETSNLIKISERPERGTTATTWEGFLTDWASHGVAQPIHVIVAGGATTSEGEKAHCMVELTLSDPPNQTGASSATWTGSLLESSETCPNAANIGLDQASVIIGPVVIGEQDEDLPDRFSRKFQKASGKRARCHLRAQARATGSEIDGRLGREKARCERSFKRRVTRAARRSDVGEVFSASEHRLDLNIQKLTAAVTDAAQGTRTGEWNYGVGAGMATISDSNTLYLSLLDAPGLTSYNSDSDRSHEALTWSAFLDRWSRHADALAEDPPTAMLGGNYVDGSGDTHHCSLSLELLGAPQIGTENVAWPVNVLDQVGTCPSEVSLEDAFLFANARTADTHQVARIHSSESASDQSPYPVEGRKGIYTALVTATTPAYCHDCTDCAYHDYSEKKSVQVYVYNFTDKKMVLQSQHYAGGVTPVDDLVIGDVNPKTRSRFAYDYRNNEQGDCKGNVTSTGGSYFEYELGETPFAINLNAAQPNPPPNKSFWEDVKSWWDDKPLWEKIVYAILAVFFIASVIATDGATAEVVDLGADLDVIMEEDGGVQVLDQLIPEGNAVFNPDYVDEELFAEITEDGYFEGLDALDEHYNFNGGLIRPLTADDVLLESDAPSNLGELANLDVSGIENFDAEDEVANVAAQNRTMSLSGFARAVLWTRARGAAGLIGEGLFLGLTGAVGAHKRYASSHQTTGAGFPKVDVRPDQSAYYFQQANINGEEKTTEVLFADNTQYGVKLDGKYVVSVQSGFSEFRGFTANRYMPAPGPLNVLSVTVFPVSSGDGPANEDGLAKTYRMTAAGYIPKSTDECPRDCGLAIDRDGVVREIRSPSDGTPWEVSEVLALDAPLSAYSVVPTDSAPESIYVGLSDGSLSRLDISANGDVTEAALGSPGDAAPVLIRPHDSSSEYMYLAFSDGTIMSNSSPENLPNGHWHDLSSWDDSNLVRNMGRVVRGPQDNACSEPDPQTPAGCYWLNWSGNSGCWESSPSSHTTQSSCVDANENCNSGGGCYQWVSNPAGYFGTSSELTVTTADGTIYEGVTHEPATGGYASFSKLRSGGGGEGLETAIFADNHMFSFFSNQESHRCGCYNLWVGDFCPDTCRSSHFNMEATSLDDVDAGACSMVKQKIISTDSKPKVGALGEYFFVGTDDDGDYDIQRFDAYAPCDDPQETYADQFEVLKSEPVTTMSSTPKGLWVGLKNGSILHYNSDDGMKLLTSSSTTGNGCSEPGAQGTGCYWLSNTTGCWEASEAHFHTSEEACKNLDQCGAGGACYSYVASWSDFAVESITPGPNDLSAIVSVRRPGFGAKKRMLTCQKGQTDCSWHN